MGEKKFPHTLLPLYLARGRFNAGNVRRPQRKARLPIAIEVGT